MVCLKGTGKLIGNLYFNKITPEKVDTYGIGFVFNKHYQGKGYATEAVICLLNYLFNSLKAHRIIAYCNTENMASWRLLERVNFRREATRIDNMFFKADEYGNPLWFSSYQYALLEREYNRRESMTIKN